MAMGGSIVWLANSAVGSSVDTDAQAFFTVSGVTDTTQKNATNQLAKDLKINGTWNKYDVIYPLVGGDAAKHSYNLKNPANFQIAWGGTVTHDANGITGSSNGFGNTGYNPSINATLGNSHISVYCRTDKAAANQVEMGAIVYDGTNDSSWSEWGMQLKSATGDFYGYIIAGSFAGYHFVTNPDSRGYFATARADTSNIRVFRNNTKVIDLPQQQSFLINSPIKLLCTAFNGVNERHSLVNLALVTIGQNLTDSEVVADRAAFQAFQTTLGRQV